MKKLILIAAMTLTAVYGGADVLDGSVNQAANKTQTAMLEMGL